MLSMTNGVKAGVMIVIIAAFLLFWIVVGVINCPLTVVIPVALLAIAVVTAILFTVIRG